MSMMKNGNPNVIEMPGRWSKNDGNNVNIDREARMLAENATAFQSGFRFDKPR